MNGKSSNSNNSGLKTRNSSDLRSSVSSSVWQVNYPYVEYWEHRAASALGGTGDLGPVFPPAAPPWQRQICVTAAPACSDPGMQSKVFPNVANRTTLLTQSLDRSATGAGSGGSAGQVSAGDAGVDWW